MSLLHVRPSLAHEGLKGASRSRLQVGGGGGHELQNPRGERTVRAQETQRLVLALHVSLDLLADVNQTGDVEAVDAVLLEKCVNQLIAVHVEPVKHSVLLGKVGNVLRQHERSLVLLGCRTPGRELAQGRGQVAHFSKGLDRA